MVGGELGLGVLHGGGHSSGGRRGGQPAILFWLVVVVLLCVALTQRKVIAHIPQACWKAYRKGVKARRRGSDPEHDSDASGGEKRLPPALGEGEVFPIDLDQEDKEERTRRQPRESSEDEAESSSEEELSDDELAAHLITTPLDELIPNGRD